MQSFAPLRLALLACAAALTPTPMDRRSAMKLPLAVALVPVAAVVAPGAARATADVIVSGTAVLADSVDASSFSPDAALYVTMKRGGGPQAVIALAKAAPEPSLAAVRITIKGKTFPIEFSITKAALFPDAPALPADEKLKDVALTISLRLDQDGVAATRGPEDLVGSVYTTPSSAPAAIKLEQRGVVSKFMK